MSHTRCPYCGGTEGRCVVVGGGRFLTECRSCGRVVEERRSEVEEMFVERAHDAPLCIVTPDFSENECYRAPPLEDDPFESIGFITAFSTWSLELSPLFTVTSTCFGGQLAELERVLSDSLFSGGGGGPTNMAGASMSMVDTLRAYFQIVEVSSVLGLERDSCDHAIQLFRDCLSTTYLRNRNIEALATAALVQAIREAQEPRTLQEISAAANIPQKEIGRHMKVLSDALKLSQPFNSNSISVHMPRFCNLLQLSKTTQDLATHIGEVVINKSFCTRRNPISISAAAIYLSCQLEDKRKTQTEICKATGLTEVTLRKVYKELLENLDDLLPPDYTPAVPLEKAFPVTAAALGRVCVARAAAGAALSEPSATASPYSGVSNINAGLAGDASSVMGGSGGSSPGQATLVRAPAAMNSGMDRLSTAPFRGPTPSTDGRSGMHLFGLPSSAPSSSSGMDVLDRGRIAENAKEMERDRSERDREKERERERLDSEFGSGPKKVNMMSSAATVAGFRPSFFPFAQVDPRLFQELNQGMWPVHALYGPPSAVRTDEGTASGRGNERNREEAATGTAQSTMKAPPQFLGIFPGMTEGMNPSMQLKMLQLIGSRPPDAMDHQGTDREVERDLDAETADSGSHNSAALSTNQSTATLSAFAAAAAATASGRPPAFPGFPPALWPFVNMGSSGPYGVFPPQLMPAAGGGVPQAIAQGGENHANLQEKGVGSLGLEALSHGFFSPTGTDSLGRIAPAMVTGQGTQTNTLTLWPNPPFAHLFLSSSANSSSGGGSGAGVCDGPNGSSGTKRDGTAADASARLSVGSGSGLLSSAQRSTTTDLFPMLTIGGSHGGQALQTHASNSSQRTDNGETTTATAAMANKPPSF